MASPNDQTLLAQQKEAVHVLSIKGLAAYNQHLQRLRISDFLNKEEKEYFVSLNLEDEVDYIATGPTGNPLQVDPDEVDNAVVFSSSVDYEGFHSASGRMRSRSTILQRRLRDIRTQCIPFPRAPRIVFSPGIIQEICKMIQNCSRSIEIAVFMFTYEIIFKKICQKKRDNPDIDIVILVDKSQFAEFKKMAENVIGKYFKNNKLGIKVSDVMRNGFKPGRAHEKFMIVDESDALTGSFNFTWTSEYINYEQVIISNDKKAIVTPLLNHFRMMSQGKNYQIL